MPDCAAEDLWIGRGHAPNRRVAEDGKEYTLKEYKEYYGYFAGCQKWNEATPYRTRRVAEDGKKYTLEEYRDYYKYGTGTKKWREAAERTTA